MNKITRSKDPIDRETVMFVLLIIWMCAVIGLCGWLRAAEFI